ncbi:MFS transporter [Pedobacter sp. HMF7647]|uniref:MFS transporter n=1 Tax=Hufsiella arboris TaxID=2695275 RepID=A0A7K1YFN6_9SPHI|nr:MFS transporter [Hufsiella arboris]MXV53260.1 MFS transporter [Hufsiella arboris]
METLIIETPNSTAVKRIHLVSLFVICFLSTAFGGVISTLMSVYLPVVVKDLQVTTNTAKLDTISGYINSLFIFGWTAGGFLWGLISDKTGRKTAFLLALGSYGLATIATGLMSNWEGVMVCRFLSGVGVGGVLAVSVVLLSEIWPEKTRAIFIGIISVAFPIGIFSAGLINFFVSSWRQGFFVGLVPIAIAIIGIWTLKESDLWLLHRSGRTNKVKKSDALFSISNRKALITGSVIFGTMLIGMWALFSWMPTWIQSLFTVDAPKERGLSMMFLGMGGLTGGFSSGWVANTIGLRRSLISSFAVCAIMAFILFKTNDHFSTIIYIEIAVLALFFGVSQGVLSVYIPMLFPTSVRASATGFCFNIGRLFTGAAVLFIGVLVNVMGGYANSLFIFSWVFVVGLLVVIFIRDIQPVNQVEK